MYMLSAQGRAAASEQASVAPASLGMCDPAVLNMTVPFSRAAFTSSSVMRASSNEEPRGVDTGATLITMNGNGREKYGKGKD